MGGKLSWKSGEGLFWLSYRHQYDPSLSGMASQFNRGTISEGYELRENAHLKEKKVINLSSELKLKYFVDGHPMPRHRLTSGFPLQWQSLSVHAWS
jgi:hypothetical protein